MLEIARPRVGGVGAFACASFPASANGGGTLKVGLGGGEGLLSGDFGGVGCLVGDGVAV